jgi:hypothetical protein
VLPRFENTCYIKLKPGNHFGLIDIVGSAMNHDFDYENWWEN